MFRVECDPLKVGFADEVLKLENKMVHHRRRLRNPPDSNSRRTENVLVPSPFCTKQIFEKLLCFEEREKLKSFTMMMVPMEHYRVAIVVETQSPDSKQTPRGIHRY